MTKLTQPLKWHDIPGFPGYRAGDNGSVWSCWRSTGGTVRTQAMSGHWKKLKPQPRPEDGRKRYTVKDAAGKLCRLYASHLVLCVFVGPCPPGMEACHGDGDCTNDAADNLRWDTPLANKADMLRHGTRQRGEQINTAKLDEAAVREIRRIGKPLRQHAQKHGVTESLISAILNRKVWQHV